MQSRKKIVLVIGMLVCFLIAVGYKTKNKMLKTKAVDEKLSALPQFNFTTAGDQYLNSFNLNDTEKILLVAFNSECDDCHTETKEILGNVSELDDFNIILLSNQPLDEVKKFSNSYHLDIHPNIFVGTMNYDKHFEIFGNIITPTSFAYDSRLLTKKFLSGIDFEYLKAM